MMLLTDAGAKGCGVGSPTTGNAGSDDDELMMWYGCLQTGDVLKITNLCGP